MKQEATGIILAGGKSKRMGTDKGFVRLLNKPLIQYAIDILKPLCRHLIISSNNPDYEQFGLPVIEDLVEDAGPMSGIFSGLSFSSTRKNLVLSCDMPLVNKGLLEALLNDESGIMAVPEHDSLLEPLCACYPKESKDLLEDYLNSARFKLMDLIKENPVSKIHIHPGLPFYSDNLFININRPEDLQRATRLYPS